MKTLIMATLMVMSMSAPGSEAQPSYLALGDSYTIGEKVPKQLRWPVQLVRALNERGQPLSVPHVIARTGWTTDELMATMDRVEIDGCFDLVSLSIGVNNQFRGRSVENFRQEYTQLLRRSIELAGGNTQRVIVLSIPDWSVTPFGRSTGRDMSVESKQLSAYNQAKREITETFGVSYFDITPSTLKAADDDSLLAADGLHPSGKLYAIWVEQIIADVEALLPTPSGC